VTVLKGQWFSISSAQGSLDLEYERKKERRKKRKKEEEEEKKKKEEKKRS